jgi:Spy/CpxP family protein refolding chaperone
MSDSTEINPKEPSSARRLRVTAFWVGSALALAALVVVAVTSCRPHGFGHDPQAMREHAAVATERLLRRIDATDEQRARVRTIVDSVIDDLASLRTDHRGLHLAAVAELTKPSIDREALEALRAEHVRAIDEASQRVVEAIADIGDALTQEQRVELAELADRFPHRWHGRGWRHGRE